MPLLLAPCTSGLLARTCFACDDRPLDGLHPTRCMYLPGIAEAASADPFPNPRAAQMTFQRWWLDGLGKAVRTRLLIHLVWNNLLQVQWPAVKTKSTKAFTKNLWYASYCTSTLCTVLMINAFRTREINLLFKITITSQQRISIQFMQAMA